jgi:redox-sensitive bicupin YhaK (pirin superfamily)
LNDNGGVQAGNVVLMDADSDEKRRLRMKTSSSSKAGVMLFAGKKLNEPIAWHGPIVMNTQKQIQDTIHELRSGQFPPSRVPWDYKILSAFPHSTESEL